MSNIDELKHYGIKGQKWGVRRYQNSDGSLTNLGKQRYSDTERAQLYKYVKKNSRRDPSLEGVEDFRDAGRLLNNRRSIVMKQVDNLINEAQREVNSLASNKDFVSKMQKIQGNDTSKESLKKKINFIFSGQRNIIH